VFCFNRPAEEFYGVPARVVEGRSLDELRLKPEGRTERIKRRFAECLESGESIQYRDYAPVDTPRGRRWVHTTLSPLIDPTQDMHRIMATFIDVTELRESEEMLADALTKVLGGFIPICSACKKIRASDESWQSVERYISRHSGARFSHTMCPDCQKEWYGHLTE
ncbi:MAG TPA: PAS domain S-box protein, partial [Longimicrobiales bacterium]|nr:PAS domain S-box protein [Longimicrobiales bacterium]